MHYALFNGSEGFVLKPPEMVLQATVPATILSQSPSTPKKASGDLGVADHYWPPARDVLHLITIKVLSLHMCPKVCIAASLASDLCYLLRGLGTWVWPDLGLVGRLEPTGSTRVAPTSLPRSVASTVLCTMGDVAHATNSSQFSAG
eukprot:3059733-Prymnesium_polylepis.1